MHTAATLDARPDPVSSKRSRRNTSGSSRLSRNATAGDQAIDRNQTGSNGSPESGLSHRE
eukprot:1187573-Prorocentrum_minimum.AAC.1